VDAKVKAVLPTLLLYAPPELGDDALEENVMASPRLVSWRSSMSRVSALAT